MKIPRQLRGLLGNDRETQPVPPAQPEAPARPASPTPASPTPASPTPEAAATPTPPPPPEPPAPRLDPTVQALLDTGVFDVEWYQAQTGLSFAGPAAAVEHYVAQGTVRRFSPHPLFEPELTDPQWNKREADPLLHFLATGEFAGHPLFQDGELDQREGEHQGQRWLRWVRQATPETLVPGQPHPWGQVRGAMLAAAAEWRHDDELTAGGRWVLRTPLLPPVRTERTGATAESAGPAHPAVSPSSPAAPGPLVSVVVTGTGDAGALAATLRSVLGQVGARVEALVVVTPGSTEEAAEAARSAGRDPRVHLVPSDASSPAAAREQGLGEATGEYIAFLSAGTTWERSHLHHVVAYMSSNGWAMAHGVVQDAATSRYRAFAGSYEHLLRGNYIDLATLVVSRGLLERASGLPGEGPDPDTATVLRLAALEPPHLVPVLSVVRPSVQRDRDADLREQAVLARHLLHRYDAGTPVAGRTSVIIPARHFNRSVTPIAAMADETLEVILVGNHTRVHRCFAAGALAGWPARLVGYPRTDNWALLASLGVASATGEKIVLLRQGGKPSRGLIDRLAAELDEPGVAISQPLCRYPDDTVAALGAGFPEQVARRRVVTPFPLFDGFAAGVVPPGPRVAVPAAWSDAVAVRRTDLIAVGGPAAELGNDFVTPDLSLSLAEAGFGSAVSLPGLRFTVTPDQRFGFESHAALSARAFGRRHPEVPGGSREILARSGLAVTGWDAERLGATGDPERPEWSMRPRLTRRSHIEVTEGAPGLWWTLDTAATAGPLGDQWGDTHFAESLAAALRRHGQTVSVDRRQARGRATRADDDVTLVLRGLNRVEPAPNQLTAMWVISHPEDVTPEEVADYDLVFAASRLWAERRSADWGVPVEPLLQCTDPEWFNPGRAEPDTGPGVLWVGNSRGVERPMLRMAVASGAPVSIYGSGWRPFVDPSLVISEFVPNDLLGTLYAGAGVVLNDHWEDMQRDGFLSNRLFDAVACGARVLSDGVEGIDELFAGSVRTVTTQEDVDRVLTGRVDDWFADRATRLATAARVAAEHSFDARARRLVDAVARVRARTDPDS